MTFTAAQLWIIPALPLVAAAVGALAPRRARALTAGAALAALAGAFLASCLALQAALADPAAKQVWNFAWFEVGGAPLRMGLLLDPLTALMAVMVSFVGLLIFVFSTGYMRDDANVARFFCFLSLFAAAMLGLIVANSLLLLFICWELVGLASYLLIGFWFHRPEAAAAAKKAFITTRIGDLGLLLGLLWLQHAGGTLLCYDHGQGVLEPAVLNGLAGHSVAGGFALSTAIGLLVFCGAVGKSGQFPLHVWLPDAMEGPTPVSALIHAATMVAAGVFLVARVYPLMAADLVRPEVPLHALTVVAFTGAATALLGALVAVAQHDIKRILAFSTVSQLGYMMLAVGVGSWTAAVFHLLTHAFFKALLFLGAGSVIHAAHHEQDIRFLGGLRGRMRTTFTTFAVGMMALAGVPFLFSGFWSKEAILHAAQVWPVSPLPFLASLVAVALTAFYSTRLVAEVFYAAPRSPAAEEAREGGWPLTVPLLLLAVGAVGLGFLGTPAFPWLQAALEGQAEVPRGPLLAGVGLMVGSAALVALGAGAGWAVYGRRPRTSPADRDPLEVLTPTVFHALGRRLGFDELYAATALRANEALARLADFLDRGVWGGAVRLVAGLGLLGGAVGRETDEQTLNGGFDAATRGARGLGLLYSRLQTGQVHGYLRTLAFGFVLVLIFVMLGGTR